MAEKLSRQRLVLAGGTLAAALGIGYVMQATSTHDVRYDPAPGASAEAPVAAPQSPAPQAEAPKQALDQAQAGAAAWAPAADAADGDVTPRVTADLGTLVPLGGLDTTLVQPAEEPALSLDLSQVEPVAAAPAPHFERAAPSALPAPLRRDATVAEGGLPIDDEAEVACTINLQAETRAAAMVALSLKAPCLPERAVTLHHNGLMFTEMTDASGTLEIGVPAMAQKAVFIAAFDSGEGAVTTLDVPALARYDRVALQWQGSAGLELHALEFGAAYFSQGHVWAEAPRAPGNARGFVTALGAPQVEQPRLAQVYTYPRAASPAAGRIALSVEAAVTPENCGTEISAQTLEHRGAFGQRVRDVDLFMPDCDAAGDFLVLKNLLEDLTIAAR